MSITIDVEPTILADLQEKAVAAGMTLEQYVSRLVERRASKGPKKSALRAYGVPYYGKGTQGDEEIWYTRDQDSQSMLIEALREIGIEFFWNIDNRRTARGGTMATDLSLWHSRDLAICCTRLPLIAKETRTSVPQTGTAIETHLTNVAGSVWQTLSRTQNVLHSSVFHRLPEECLAWKSCIFHRQEKATLRGFGESMGSHGDVPFEGSESSVGYLFYSPPGKGTAKCGFLSAFGHAGFEGLTWLHILRWNLAHSLLAPIFSEGKARLVACCFEIPDKDHTEIKNLQEVPFSIVINAKLDEGEWRDARPPSDPPYVFPGDLPWSRRGIPSQ